MQVSSTGSPCLITTNEFRHRSQIESLRIQGIRSFDNQVSSRIDFQAPLTLIVGYNGSGKTTIIECLKYAATGQQPPNSKGGAFIHDPKLAGELKTVLAQVKLQFKNSSKQTCVITRSMELTVKKGGAVSQKTLDCNLVMKNHGERISLSTKVMELDQIVPANLGVSPAVLEFVIFCHQDESLWPMSEPSKLKQYFDRIFDASKYTKAIENIGKMRKYHQQELGKDKIRETHAKAAKDKAMIVQKKMVTLQDDIEALSKKSQDLNRQMKEAQADAAEKHKLKNEALGIVNELDTNRRQAKGFEYTLESLRTTLVELQDSDEWLQTTLDQYEERMGQYQKKAEEHNAQYVELQAADKSSRRQMDSRLAERGQHLAERAHHNEQLQLRVKYVKEAARSHSLRGYDGELDDSQIGEFVSRVRKMAQEKDRELDRIQNETDEELKKTQSVLSDLGNTKSAQTQQRINAQQLIASNDKKSKAKQLETNTIHTDEGRLGALDAALAEVKARLQRASSEFETAGWDVKLQQEKRHLQELEAQADHLSIESVQCNKHVSERAALEYESKEAKKAQHSLSIMISSHKERLDEIIGAGWSTAELDREYQLVLDQRARSLADAKKEKDTVDQIYNEKTFQLTTAQAALKKKTEEMNQCQKTVLASIVDEDGKPITSVDQYLEELESLADERSSEQKALDGSVYISEYYRSCLRTIEEDDCCRLCLRSFEGPKQRASATTKIQRELVKFEKGQREKELARLDKEFEKADAARFQYNNYKKLHDIEIPSLEKEVKDLEKEQAETVTRAERQDIIVRDHETSKRDADGIAKTVNDITNYHTAIQKHGEEIDRLATQQKSSGTSRTVDEIQEELTICNERSRALKSKIDKIAADRDVARSEINRLEIESSNTSSKLHQEKSMLEKKQGIQATIEELRESTTQQREIIQLADTVLMSLVPDIAKAKTKHEDAQRRGQSKAKDVQAEKDKLAQTVNKFKLVENQINAYIEKRGPENLAACERAIKALEQDQKRIEQEMNDVSAHHNKLKAEMADSERHKRSIQDNIVYRKTLRDLEAVDNEIARLEERNADEDYEQFLHEAETADTHYQMLLAERGPLVGEIKRADNELVGLIKEWEEEYESAAQVYREWHVKVETSKAAIEDMLKCSKALDSAIIKYHSAKMEEINAIAGELWQSTYQGSDVDTIMIRSEAEAGTASETSTRRSFAYRVVMVKQGAELDMRGRCSAGQKVLASIIVRLALAECFGTNCGVIALDEPTTNLDRDNIKALAVSLNKIIHTRRHQSNFQLIIITHDEEFLKEMKCAEFCETYWRISRDANQKSMIERQELNDLMLS